MRSFDVWRVNLDFLPRSGQREAKYNGQYEKERR